MRLGWGINTNVADYCKRLVNISPFRKKAPKLSFGNRLYRSTHDIRGADIHTAGNSARGIIAHSWRFSDQNTGLRHIVRYVSFKSSVLSAARLESGSVNSPTTHRKTVDPLDHLLDEFPPGPFLIDELLLNSHAPALLLLAVLLMDVPVADCTPPRDALLREVLRLGLRPREDPPSQIAIDAHPIAPQTNCRSPPGFLSGMIHPETL